MIDIHAHIVPGVDDGSPDLEDSVLMAELAVEGGVDTIITTPHGNMSEGPARRLEEQEHTGLIRKRLEELQTELVKRNIPLRLYSGMEIFTTEDTVSLLQEGILLPMAGTDHCLIEFDFDASAAWCTRRIVEILDAGWKVIIAHPERYDCVQSDFYTAESWIAMGCQLQANRGSILGSFGREPHRAAWEMLERDFYTYVGSDAHSPYHRTTYMKDVYEVICDAFSVRKADELLEHNARLLLTGIQ